MQMMQTFRKQERLKSSRVIRKLFSSGQSFLVHPFKVNWMSRDAGGKYPARVLISISRRNFRRAGTRNKLKRLCREAYRRHKHSLYDYLNNEQLGCDLAIIYIGKEAEDYSKLEKKIIKLIDRLVSELDYKKQEKTS
jgi:ribonuclease P protein component